MEPIEKIVALMAITVIGSFTCAIGYLVIMLYVEIEKKEHMDGLIKCETELAEYYKDR